MKHFSGKLRFVYLGNLGRAHDVPLFLDFLQACAREIETEVGFVGTAEASLGPVREAAAARGFRVEQHPHVAFEQLPQKLPPLRFDYGLVAFSEKFAGLLSPSKFSGYLVANLPIVYLGPPGTNGAMVCDRFGAGRRLDRSSLAPEVLRGVLRAMLAQRGSAELTARVGEARAFFDRFDGEYLACEISRRL